MASDSGVRWSTRLLAMVASREFVASSADGGTAAGLDALLRRVTAGESNAFTGVYDRLAGPVFGICLHVLRDTGHAADATQNIMLELWQHAGDYDPTRGSAQAWALTIAHRRAIDRTRALQAATNRERRYAAGAHTPAFDTVADAVPDRAACSQLHVALAGLTDKQRQMIWLTYYRGHTITEAAALLHIPPGTAKTRVRGALLHLRHTCYPDPEACREES